MLFTLDGNLKNRRRLCGVNNNQSLLCQLFLGELAGAGYDGCSGAGQSGLCQIAP